MLDTLAEGINWLIEEMAASADALISSLPSATLITFENALPTELLGMLNWFIPIAEMLVVAEQWLVMIVLWYALAPLIRLLKGAR